MFADITLRNGRPGPGNIYGTVDVFNRLGYMKVLYLAVIFYFAKYFLTAMQQLIWMTGMYLFTPGIKICKAGEFVFFDNDLCLMFFGGYEPEGLPQFGEFYEGKMVTY